MKILFFIFQPSDVRWVETGVNELAARGHDIHFMMERDRGQLSTEVLDVMQRQYANITYQLLPEVGPRSWISTARYVRSAVEYLRYLQQAYRDAPALLARIGRRTPLGVARLARLPVFRSRVGVAMLSAIYRALDAAAPCHSEIVELLQSQAPDIVLFTPLVVLNSVQPYYLATARQAGLRTGYCVGSWDHLSSKALLRDIPDRVFVWNDIQRDEAQRMHRVPASRIVVTGAQVFDFWFDLRPTSREVFCRRLDIDSAKPYILYVCSSPFLRSMAESRYVMRWITGLRSSGNPVLRDVTVVIRPHPKRAHEWREVPWRRRPNVVLWPVGGTLPFHKDEKADYFDSLYHARVVVGLNTSAMVESAVLNKPVLTILAPEFQESQTGTLHFRYLMNADYGLLHVAKSVAEHHGHLIAALQHPENMAARSGQFVNHFIRPRGRDVTAGQVFADEIESFGRNDAVEAERQSIASDMALCIARPVFAAIVAMRGRRARGDDNRLRRV